MTSKTLTGCKSLVLMKTSMWRQCFQSVFRAGRGEISEAAGYHSLCVAEPLMQCVTRQSRQSLVTRRKPDATPDATAFGSLGSDTKFGDESKLRNTDRNRINNRRCCRIEVRWVS